MTNKQGSFIIIDGPDGAGKSSLVEALKSRLKEEHPEETFVFTREPGNLINPNSISEELRKEILSSFDATPRQQAVMFAQARYHHTKDIVSELNKGNHVVCDRYIFSSIAYQGAHLGFKKIIDYNIKPLEILKQNKVIMNNIVLSINMTTYKNRLRGKSKDALESVSNKIVEERLNNCDNVISINEKLNGALDNIYLVNANENLEEVLESTVKIINNIVR